MKFERMSVASAHGAILAHSVTTPSGVIKKGRLLAEDDLARIAAAGVDRVYAARLEPGDVGEDAAAERIARAAVGATAHATAPFTGRCNLVADGDGLLIVDAGLLDEINALDEGLTVATLPRYERVAAGQMIATVKIITFAVPESAVARAEALLRQAGGLVRVAPLRAADAALVLTKLPGTRANVLEKRKRAIQTRLEALGSRLAAVETVAHEEAAVADAIGRMVGAGHDPVIVFAASAIVDRADVIPAALVAAGGAIERLGMPVDPGNLMLLGRLSKTDVIGAPSCAASPKLNGFDWVLERRLAGLPVSATDIAAMGLGGLLKEIASRPQPRDGVTEDGGSRHAPRIAAVILAAGRSTRYGARNKLVEEIDGAPMVAHVVRAALASRADGVLVVTGHEAEHVRKALAGLPVTFVHNDAYRDGLSSSLKCGIAAVLSRADGAIVCLGDMPGITMHDIDRLIAAFAPKEGRSIVVPIHGGKRGNPVLFAREHFAEILEVEGDTGARHVIGANADAVAEVDLGTAAIFVDIDTPEAMSRHPGG